MTPALQLVGTRPIERRPNNIKTGHICDGVVQVVVDMENP